MCLDFYSKHYIKYMNSFVTTETSLDYLFNGFSLSKSQFDYKKMYRPVYTKLIIIIYFLEKNVRDVFFYVFSLSHSKKQLFL